VNPRRDPGVGEFDIRHDGAPDHSPSFVGSGDLKGPGTPYFSVACAERGEAGGWSRYPVVEGHAPGAAR
jgi:hypothetical protein